ncbi:MAG: lamin tail domain-containing protein [Verrucomicrobiota bacterium]
MSIRLVVFLSCFPFLSLPAAEIFPIDSDWQLFKGFSEASSPDPAAWRAINFNDSGWTPAPAPFWYGDAQPSPGTLLNDMRGQYTCIFLRRTFVINNPADIAELQLRALSDDGFIAWINGKEVARYNMPEGDLPFNATALPALSEPIPYETHLIPNPASFLVAGVNVIAVQAFNASLNGSSDLVFNAALSGTIDESAPTMAMVIPTPGATVRDLTQIEIAFSEDVTGVDASDLLINGQGATNLVPFNASQYVFEFPEPPAGSVQVAWKGNHGIRDLSAAGNAFTGGSWTYNLNPNAPPPGVNISEFLTDNRDTINDEDGDASDWIEIHNAGTVTASLNGWYLTDDTNNLAKWRFPNVSIPADGYLLVFASEKNRTNPLARLHTNFKLSASGEYLALVDSGGRVISDFGQRYPEQLEDVSYGRQRGAPELLAFFPTPTPGAPNSVGGPGFSPAIQFSRIGGTFVGSFALTLSTVSPDAVIRYTLDGSLPTESSAIYTTPINISATTQVRARSFESGLLPGPVRSESFIALASSVVNFTSDLPLLIIHNFGAGSVPANGDQFAYIALFEPGDNGRTSLTNAPALRTRAGINIRGSSTLFYPKSSFSVEWWDEFDQDRDLSPLGLPAESDWVLYAPNNFEPVLIHNPFIFQLSNDIGRYAPRTRFVEVYLNTSGGTVSSANYNGIYVLMEKIKRGPDRVDVHGLEPEHTRPPQVTGGYMMKIDRLDPGDSGFNAAQQNIGYVDPKEPEIELPQRDPQEQYIRNYMNAFGTALNGANYTNPTTGYPAYVDAPSWLDHHILNVLAFNVDALRLSAYFYKEREGKLGFGPIWDFDRALGSTDGRDSNPRVWRSRSGDLGTDFFNYPWWGRMFTDPNFWQGWIDRWQELRDSHFSIANLNALVDRFANQVRQAQPREQGRWGVAPRGGSYQSEVNMMKSWLASRVNFIDTNFLAKPVLSRLGGPIEAGETLTLSGPAGATLYYTMDGTDPRASGGNVALGARVYTGPITLNGNARIVARAHNPNHRNLTGANNPPISSPWSGVAAATYVVSTPPLVITELMYHPEDAPAGNTNAPGNFEFVEVKNLSNQPLALGGFRLRGGVEFVFPNMTLNGGQSTVVVKDVEAFRSRYGSGPSIAGAFDGQLNDAGDLVILEGPLQEPIHSFRYSDEWFPITDGFGFSLVIVNDSAPLNTWTNAAAWRPSSRIGGSPSADDSPPAALPVVLVNEALTHTDPPNVDAIELFNPTAAEADLSGWYLTDDFRAPKKYRFTAGTRLAAGGYLVVDESRFNAGGPQSFSLSSLGDEVYLFSADAAGNLTGFFHGFDFGAAENGVSFGRHLTSTGGDQFVAQSRVSLGEPNAGPRVGPVVIHEIHFNPQPIFGTNNNTIDEYIELRNISGQTVPLFDPNARTNTWKLDDAVQFVFPQNASIAPESYLLVVGFDPANTTALAAFRNRFGVDPAVPIFGPFMGNLNNAGEDVELFKPDPPQAATAPQPGFVPYVLVDRIKYSNVFPWPSEADGSGKSLQRRIGAAFGNDPINWQAASPTPGQANAITGTGDDDSDGLPDDWELAHGLDPRVATGFDGPGGDPDGDGATNLQEFTSGTHPRDGSSYLKVTLVSGTATTARLKFQAVAGKTYSILYRDQLDNGSWRKLADIPARPVNETVEIPDNNVASAQTRFYRLVTPAVP